MYKTDWEWFWLKGVDSPIMQFLPSPAPEEDSNSFLNHKLGDMKITLFKIISCFFLQIEKVEAREVK
jgi:hypothetical protein